MTKWSSAESSGFARKVDFPLYARKEECIYETLPCGSYAGLHSQTLAESDRTASMDHKEFFKDFFEGETKPSFPSMVGDVWMTRKECAALSRWGEMARDNNPEIRRTVHPAHWERSIRSAYATLKQARRAQPQPRMEVEPFQEKLLELSKHNAENAKHPLLHYCPCYLFDTKNAEPFKVGTLEFIPGPYLVDLIESAADRELSWRLEYEALNANTEAKLADSSYGHTAPYVKEMSSWPWIVIVPTKGYEPRMAQKRANDVAMLAIAGVGLRLWPEQCAFMSLVYESARRQSDWIMMLQRPGEDVGVGYFGRPSQVHATKPGLEKFIAANRPYFAWLGEAISEAFASNPSEPNANAGELREARLNALKLVLLRMLRAVRCTLGNLLRECAGKSVATDRRGSDHQ